MSLLSHKTFGFLYKLLEIEDPSTIDHHSKKFHSSMGGTIKCVWISKYWLGNVSLYAQHIEMHLPHLSYQGMANLFDQTQWDKVKNMTDK